MFTPRGMLQSLSGHPLGPAGSVEHQNLQNACARPASAPACLHPQLEPAAGACPAQMHDHAHIASDQAKQHTRCATVRSKTGRLRLGLRPAALHKLRAVQTIHSAHTKPLQCTPCITTLHRTVAEQISVHMLLWSASPRTASQPIAAQPAGGSFCFQTHRNTNRLPRLLRLLHANCVT